MKNRLHASAVVITVLIASSMLASVCAGRVVACPTDMPGMDMFDDRRLNMIDPSMGMGIDRGMNVGIGSTYPERLEMRSTEADNPFTHGIAAGDLNGDGGDDVLIFNGTYNSSGYLGTYAYDCVSAVNGRDGTELWQQEIAYNMLFFSPDYPAYPVGDIDGVAGANVIMESCSYDSGTDTCTATIQVIQGSNGTELWSHSITGNGQYGTSLYSWWYGDLVGDGLNDAVVVSQYYNPIADNTTRVLRIMQGSDGTEVWNKSTKEDGQTYMLFPWVCLCGDICGDNKDDVLVMSRSSETTHTVRALQGSDGAEIWSTSFETDTSPFICPCGDLVGGDGRGDIVITAHSYDSVENETTCTVYVVQGSNGDKSWNKNTTKSGEHDLFLLHAYPCSNLVGSASGDLIIGSQIYDSDADVTTATLNVLQGTNGHEFWNRTIIGEGVSLAAFPNTALDGAGDDLIIQSTSCDSTAGTSTHTIYAVRGSNGHDFWNQSVTGDDEDCEDCEDRTGIEVYPYCDLDGDGNDEVIVNSWSYDSGTGDTAATVTVRDGNTPSVFWSDSISGPNASMIASSYGDLDGGGKDDVVVTRSYDSGTGNTTASVCVRKDNTETELWDDSVTGNGVWVEPNYYAFWHYQPDQDYDHDNLHDLLITTGASIDNMYGFHIGSAKIPTRVCAVKGNTGTSLWCKPSPSSEPKPSATGDLNDDGVITPADAVIALNIAVSGNCSEDADVNGDGVVNSLDAFMILQAAAGAITL
jgi:hypothetical protein